MFQYFDVSNRTSSKVGARRVMGRAGVCLHSTEGTNSLAWLQGDSADAGEPASADFLIARDGDIYQISKLNWYAYHIGVGSWHRLDNKNNIVSQLLVGIEHESHDGNSPRYTNEQLISSAALVRRLARQHYFGVVNTEYHKFIATPPGRRSDPVNFPLYVWCNELLNPSPMAASMVFPEVLP